MRARIAEGPISWVRLAIIAFNVTVYWAWLPHGARHGLASAICVIALGYAVVVVSVRPHRLLPVLGSSAFTMASDSALIAAWLYATGGLASPFWPLWFLSLVAIAFRFGTRIVLGSAGLYAIADVSMLALSGDLVSAPIQALVRGAYIVAIGSLCAVLTAAWSRAVQERIDMDERIMEHEHELRDTRRIRALADAAFEALIIHRNGIVVEANEAAVHVFGKPREAIIGSHATSLVAASSKRVVQTRIEAPQDSPYEIWIDRHGERRRVAVQGRDIEFHGRMARVVAVRDVTQEHEAREAERVALEQQAEIERLQEIDRFRRRFVNTAAHELNTPLTPIRLQLALLERRHGREGFAVLERNVERLSRLVQDLLDAAKLEDQRMRLYPDRHDVGVIAAEAVESFSQQAKSLGVELCVDAQRAVADVDRQRLSQVLHNLLSNALKFTPEGGRIDVAVRAREQIVIEVRDTGPGIPADGVERLFQPFSMLHDNPGVPGTGLGLYICRQLVEAMDGTISLLEGPGAAFAVHLPMVPELTAKV